MQKSGEACFLNGLSNPDRNQKKKVSMAVAILTFLVGVSGFEPEASWTRTKRDTKLRHTPIDQVIIMIFPNVVKGIIEIPRKTGG